MEVVGVAGGLSNVVAEGEYTEEAVCKDLERGLLLSLPKCHCDGHQLSSVDSVSFCVRADRYSYSTGPGEDHPGPNGVVSGDYGPISVDEVLFVPPRGVRAYI